MDKINRWFFGGQDARFFRENKLSIRAFNTRILGAVNGTMALITLLYFLFNLNSGASTELRYVCLGCFLVMLATYAFHIFYARKHLRTSHIYPIVVMELVFIFLLLVGPVYDSGNAAVFLPVFFVLLPIIVIENFYVILSVALVDLAIFGTVEFIFKNHSLATYDLIDAVTCLLLGTMIGHNVLTNRLSEIAAYAVLKKQSETELARALALANRDPLTGVKSRAAFESSLASLQEKMDEDTAEPFALAVFDVNGLRAVNDARGHDEGDRVLIESCRLICVHFKHSPVFRIGGDEFAVILTGADYAEKEALCRAFKESRIPGCEGRTVAMGLSEYRTRVDKRTGAVFIRADADMCRDKKQLKEQNQ